MISLCALGVLLVFGAPAALAQPAPGDCNNETCKVLKDVRVTRLFADQLFSDCQPVVVGDGNPCTSDDVLANGTVLHVPIENCCRTTADCDAFIENHPCHTARCDPQPFANSTHGICQFEKIVGCCACDNDCRQRACQTATCVATEGDDSVTFTKRSVDDVHFTMLSKRNSVMHADGECRYTEIEDCCETSADCTEGGPNTVGVCDKAGECIYVTSTQFECTTDAECQVDETTCAKCESKGTCFGNVCDRGFCACKPDFEKDTDGDGVCCREDCDDNNINVNSTIWCTIGNATEVNEDGDAFVKCGTAVEPVCNTTCPDGRVQVNETQLDDAWLHHKNERFVRWDCDCCDMNANDTRPDEYLFCAKDTDGDNVFDPVDNDTSPAGTDLTPPGCYDKICVLQPENRTHNRSPKDGGEGYEIVVSDAVRDQQCQEAFNDPDFVSVPPELQIPERACDQCPNDPTVSVSNIDCPDTVVFQGQTFQACSGDAENRNGTTLAACCDEILEVPGGDLIGLPPRFAEWRKCCNALKTQPGGYPSNANGTECATISGATFPLDPLDTCGCNDNPTPCERVVTCVPDKDGDGYYDCNDQDSYCVSEIPEGCDSHASQEEQDDYICRHLGGKDKKLAGIDWVLNGQQNDPTKFGINTFCDCNDKDKEAFERIVCFEDKDQDTVPKCNKTLVGQTCNNEVVCPAPVCRKKCDKGYLPLHHKVGNATVANCHIEDRKRSTLSLLESALNKRGLGYGNKPDHEPKPKPRLPCKDCEDIIADDGFSYFIDDDDHSHKSSKSSSSSSSSSGSESHHTKPSKPHHRPPRHDETCPEGLVCDVCDCCDIDKYVHEDTPFLKSYAATKPTKCGGFDYNCNCKNDSVVACPTVVTVSDGNDRLLVPVFTNLLLQTPAENVFFNTPGVAAIGRCRDPVGSPDAADCIHSPGWALEIEGSGPEDRKRQLTIALMPLCNDIVRAFEVGGVVLTKPENNTAAVARPFEPGMCASWVEGCVDLGNNNICSPDCEKCAEMRR